MGSLLVGPRQTSDVRLLSCSPSVCIAELPKADAGSSENGEPRQGRAHAVDAQPQVGRARLHRQLELALVPGVNILPQVIRGGHLSNGLICLVADGSASARVAASIG